MSATQQPRRPAGAERDASFTTLSGEPIAPLYGPEHVGDHDTQIGRPGEFLEEVKRFIQRYQGPDRPHMERALGAARKNMETMRRIFERNNLPPDRILRIVSWHQVKKMWRDRECEFIA